MDNILLILMMIGGVALFATAFLPGNHIAWRILCGVLGPVLFCWMLWVFLFGGTYYVNLFIVLLPFLLAAQGVRSMLRSRGQHPSPYPPAPDGQHAWGQQPGYPAHGPAQPPQGQPYPPPPHQQGPTHQPYQQGPPPGQAYPPPHQQGPHQAQWPPAQY